jgi:hypothetical protein
VRTNETKTEIDPELNYLLPVDPIELEELEGILKSFKNKKSPGNDGMNIELLKYTPAEIKVRFLHKIPDEWTRGVICPIFKRGNGRDCNNYRVISLLNVAYKVYAKVITRRLNIIDGYILSEEQCRFRKGRSCSDCIFIMEQLIHKRREFNLPTYILFIDCEKAFDRVPRGKLWNIMKNKGFPEHIVKTVQSLYINTRIKIDKRTSVSNKEIHINQGVKQGFPMSPTLFNTFIDKVIRQWQDV